MPTLLHIDCSPQKPSRSVSRHITAASVEAWRKRYPDGQVIHRDLAETPLTSIDQAWVDGHNQPVDQRTEDQDFALAQSERLIDELLGADLLVIGAPMHNYNLPAVLKSWLDHVILSNRTVIFTKNGPRGLLTALNAIVVTSSGGEYISSRQTQELDFETPYLRFTLEVLGVRKVRFLQVGSTNQIDAPNLSLAAFVAPWCDQMKEIVSEVSEALSQEKTTV